MSFSLIVLLGSFFFFSRSINPTGHSREWLIHYKFENEDFLYIVNGKYIYDNRQYKYVILNDTIMLHRDSILLYENLELFGKDLELDREDENNEYAHFKYYQSKKRRLLKEIDSSNVYVLKNDID
ncbi:hypothetical protein [Ulvibacterium sp.]|uniref:hypothetical protein n=1 Tax=Ulvibacterium sp. TaxID=2665914 RepID=UPI003BA907AE